MALANIPSGTRWKITSELGLWKRKEFDDRTGYKWRRICTTEVQLPPGTIPATEWIQQLVVGTVIVVTEILLDTTSSLRGRFQAVQATVEGTQLSGIVWTIHDGKFYSEPIPPTVHLDRDERCRYRVQVIQGMLDVQAKGCTLSVLRILWGHDAAKANGKYTEVLSTDPEDVETHAKIGPVGVLGMALKKESSAVLYVYIGVGKEPPSSMRVLVRFQNIYEPEGPRIPILLDFTQFDRDQHRLRRPMSGDDVKNILAGHISKIPQESVSSLREGRIDEGLWSVMLQHEISIESKRAEWSSVGYDHGKERRWLLRQGNRTQYMVKPVGPEFKLCMTIEEEICVTNEATVARVHEALAVSLGVENLTSAISSEDNFHSRGLGIFIQGGPLLFIAREEFLETYGDRKRVPSCPVRHRIYLAGAWRSPPHYTFLRAEVGTVSSDNVLYPVAQHLLFFLPGVLGTEIHIGGEKIFPELELGTPSTSIIKLASSKDGKPCYDPDPGSLEVVHGVSFAVHTIMGMETPDLKDIYPTERVVDAFLHDGQFPLLRMQSKDKFKHILFKEIPYDWRLPLGEGEFRYRFMHQIAHSIRANAKILGERHPFCSDEVSLVGHSTGGLIARAFVQGKFLGLLSDAPSAAPEERATLDAIDKAFFVNVPFWGAPKAEQGMLTGDLDINQYWRAAMVADVEIFRNAGADLFVTYALAPTQAYGKHTATKEDYWSPQSLKARVNSAALGCTYRKVRPEKKFRDIMEGGLSKPFIEDWLGNETEYRMDLASLAESFHEAICERPCIAKSYVFHSFHAGPTVCAVASVPALTPQEEKRDCTPTQWDAIRASAHAGEIHTLLAEFLLPLPPPPVGAFDTRIIHVVSSRIVAVVHYCYQFPGAPIFNYSIQSFEFFVDELFDQGKLTSYTSSVKPQIRRIVKNIGDGTVPALSQITLGDLSEQGATLMTGTRDDDSAHLEHASVCQAKWVWQQIARSYYHVDMCDVSMAWPRDLEDVEGMLSLKEGDLRFDASQEIAPNEGERMPTWPGLKQFDD